MRRPLALATVGVAVLTALSACSRSAPNEPASEHAAPSPAASQLPTPLAPPPELAPSGAPAVQGIPADSAGRLIVPEAGAPPPPEALRIDLAASPDPLPPNKDLPGISLEAEWRWSDLATPPRGADANFAAIDQVRRATAFRWKIDLAAVGRLRAEVASRAMTLAQGTEIRARLDRFGAILVWPNGDQYRALGPGSIRTLLGERRVDVVPVGRGRASGITDGGARIGVATKRQEITTRFGRAVMERAKVPNAGEGATLLCRMLLELVGVDPATAPCRDGELPMRVHYAWAQGGNLEFDVVQMAPRVDHPIGAMLAPPAGAAFAAGAVPPDTAGIFATKDELAAFRAHAPEPTPAKPSDAGAPGEGLIATNATDLLRYVVLDGVPVAYVHPGKDLYLIGPQRGRYSVQWRSFLGDVVDAPQTIELPARIIATPPAASAARDR